MMLWRRKKDGVLVKTRDRAAGEQSRESVLCERKDNGHWYWATWEGLDRKYELVESSLVPLRGNVRTDAEQP